MFRTIITPSLIMTAVSIPFIFYLNQHTTTVFLMLTMLVIFIAACLSIVLSARLPAAARPQRHRQSANSGTHSNAPRELGSVKWVNASKGFGFITRDSGDDVFVHFRSIRGEGHRVLKDGQRVEFSVSQGDKGLQADDVAPV